MTLASRTHFSLLALALVSSAIAQTPTPSKPSISPNAKTWRLTYTITESDGAKPIGSQHFALVVLAGGKTTLKQGSKIPIATGSTHDGTGTQTQFTYLDIGTNISASIEDLGAIDRVNLHTVVEQSGVAEEKLILDVREPVIRQTVLDATSMLSPGRPVTVGSLDVPGSTRHLDVVVVMDPIR